MNSQDIIQTLNSRYSVKNYDNTKKIRDEDIKTLTESFRLAPSSLGLQPWHLFVISNQDIKEKLAEVTLGYNANKIKDCSHLFVIANENKLSDDHLNEHIQLVKEVKGLVGFTLNTLKSTIKNLEDDKGIFHTHQCYIALGFMTYTAALLGIDSTIMGGINRKGCINQKGYNDVLGLDEKGLNTVIAYAVGYASSNENPLDKLKVRFPENRVITHLQ